MQMSGNAKKLVLYYTKFQFLKWKHPFLSLGLL